MTTMYQMIMKDLKSMSDFRFNVGEMNGYAQSNDKKTRVVFNIYPHSKGTVARIAIKDFIDTSDLKDFLNTPIKALEYDFDDVFGVKKITIDGIKG
jgi:hypothetical protein